ncbi:MAG: GSCFA domain-containing protein [Methylococcaceae bacterium]|nr:GSCFA domain-containing protein [Methylococcaceae bacterium]
MGLVDIPGITDADISLSVYNTAINSYSDWLKLFELGKTFPQYIVFPPPPVESSQWIIDSKSQFSEKLLTSSVKNAQSRLNFYNIQCSAIKKIAHQHLIQCIDLPKEVISQNGFLAEDCLKEGDPTHGNALYGKRVLNRIFETIITNPEYVNFDVNQRKTHPYSHLPDHAFWKQSISNREAGDVDPVTSPPFKISQKDKVATAGSCFAQHISKRLRSNGFNFLITEQAETTEESASRRGFYDFSARYGNVYTARQLLQLFERAFCYFRPLEHIWRRSDGNFCDPFRPRIEPDGFASEEELMKDVRQHLAAVRRMFKQLDVFVFTLGLTECWMSRLDGAVYPVAPGVAGGIYDESKYAFVNFGVEEVLADMRSFLNKLHLVNRKAKVILTVSPVPLAATREDSHVLVATTYSKSVLRVAADELARHPSNKVYYFPSYEIITGAHANGAYFGPDRRSVTESGVDHVMRIFMSRLTTQMDKEEPKEPTHSQDSVFAELQAIADAICDEELYARQ